MRDEMMDLLSGWSDRKVMAMVRNLKNLVKLHDGRESVAAWAELQEVKAALNALRRGHLA